MIPVPLLIFSVMPEAANAHALHQGVEFIGHPEPAAGGIEGAPVFELEILTSLGIHRFINSR